MPTQCNLGFLLVYPAFQDDGELRLSGTVVAEIAARRHHAHAPLAFLFVTCEARPASTVVRLGRYSRHHQVWEFDTDLAGSVELVPTLRRVLQPSPAPVAPE